MNTNSFILTLLLLVVVLVSASTTFAFRRPQNQRFQQQQEQGDIKFIDISEYGDEFCTGQVLVNSRAPVGKCYSGDYASGSGFLNCSDINQPSAHRCTQMHYFSDAACSQKISVHDRVCETCLGDKVGKHSELSCGSSAGDSSLTLRSECDFTSGNQQCANCNSTVKIQFKHCTQVPHHSSVRYVLVTEVSDCKKGVVNIKDYSNTRTCSSTARMSEFLIPNEGCDGGVKYTCKA